MAGPATWDQTADLEEGDDSDFDAVSPAWDDEATEAAADFNSVTQNGSSTFTATTAAVKLGTNGFSCAIDADQATAYGTFSTGFTNEPFVVVECWFDPNSLNLATDDILDFMSIITSGIGYTHGCRLRYDGTNYEIDMGITTDAGGLNVTARYDITDAYHHVRMVFAGADNPGDNDGAAYLYIDGEFKESITGVDNDVRHADGVQFGNNFDRGTSYSGTVFFDNCNWTDGPGAPPWITEGAALAGSFGMGVTPFKNATAHYAELTGPAADTVMTAVFDLDINSLTMATNDEFIVAQAVGEWYVSIKYDGSAYKIKATANLDAGTTSTSEYTLSDAAHSVQIAWKQSGGGDDGYLNFYLDDDLQESLTGLDNDTLSVDELRVGAVSGLDVGTSGAFYLDDISWTDNGDFYPVLIGSITNTGAVVKAIDLAHGFAGSITNTGSLVRTTLKVVAGSITNTGSLVRITLKVVAGSITNTGALTTVKAVLEKLYVWTAKFRATDSEDPMHASSDEKRSRA